MEQLPRQRFEPWEVCPSTIFKSLFPQKRQFYTTPTSIKTAVWLYFLVVDSVCFILSQNCPKKTLPPFAIPADNTFALKPSVPSVKKEVL